ncbi:DUF262 domain-containing protein [Agrococcus versicolor]|uniref:DUF262 domain-containing protein n=1 Tax=Agrococcus versicolor TaxID=501482 RepID=A0ABN3AW28_9MICO
MQQPSKANATELFEGRKHYAIPSYQRPYVWTEEDQWSPLWDDIVRVTESHLSPGSKQFASHFLGAVVFEVKRAGSSGLIELNVIDGQQRLTTLQLMLDAVESVFVEHERFEEAERLEELILNKQSTYRSTQQRFKLWPSQANRDEFAHAMDPSEPRPPEVGQLTGAHEFFRGEARRWLSGAPDADGRTPPADLADRAHELAETLAGRLVVVAIDLTGDDDAQLIFETLNDRGTPLLKADLIKNWVFRRGEELGADVDLWSRSIWEDFDTDWWRREIVQGRASRSRVDIFLHYWLTMRRQEEVKQELAFRTFIDYAEPFMTDADRAHRFLRELRNDADTYRGLGDFASDTVIGRFRSRVIEAMELAGTTPVFLWVISRNHGVPSDQVEVGLDAIESWVVRRTMLQLTSKDMNKLVVALLKSLRNLDPAASGEAIRSFLSQQTAGTREWPSDERFVDDLVRLKMFGNVKQGRIATVLRAVEAHKRAENPKFGAVTLPPGLTIEHIMPQKWRVHWEATLPLEPEAAQRRDRLVHSIGNLTLVTQSLNSSLSNRPWTDADASGLSEGGKPGRGKWSLLEQFNLLVLNKEVLEYTDAWAEAEIAARGTALARAITEVWPGPDREIQAAAQASTLID